MDINSIYNISSGAIKSASENAIAGVKTSALHFLHLINKHLFVKYYQVLSEKSPQMH